MRWMLLALLLCAAPTWAATLSVGDTPPSALGRNAHARENVELEALRGSVVVVTFWASWCPPCLKELPVLENLQLRVPKEALRVVAVNIDADENDYRRILAKIDSPALTITRDRKGRIKERWGVGVIPHMFLVGHDGKLAHTHRGYDEAMLEGFVGEINALLEARHAALAPGD